MTLTFANPHLLLAGVLATTLLGLFLYWMEQRAGRRLHRFAASELVGRLTESHSRRRAWVKNGLLMAAMLLGFISLARPQWGAVFEKAETRGVDIMIALDVSRSMLAEDVSPNRLERSKLAILDLLESVGGDRVGLIAFAGNAFLQCPLTLDYQAFRQTLLALDTGTIPVGGTDVAAAIDEAEAYFEQTGNERILILITDGEDLEASGVIRAREAAAKGMRILTVGVGSPAGELIPVRGPDGQVDFLRDAAGKPVSTRLDEQTLRAIADASNGLYAPLGPTGAGLERVYQFSLAQMPAAERRESLQRIPIERYRWFLVPALLLLVCESLITTRRRSPRGGAGGVLAALLCMALLLPATRADAGAASQAAAAFDDGRFEESVTLYRDALADDPDNARLAYNMGVAAYRAQRYEEAIAAFSDALKLARPALQARIFHNAGNSRVAHGYGLLDAQPELARDLWQTALDDFTNALALDGTRAPSRQNLERLREVIAAHTYILTTLAEPSEGGTVSPGGTSFHNVPFPLKADPAEGWMFAEWAGEGVEDPATATTSVRLKADTQVTARFVKAWNLTVRSADDSMGTAGTSGTYRADKPVPIKAEAKDYFAFSKWTAEGATLADASKAETEATLNADATVTASFVPAFKLSVEVDPELGGKAGPSGFFERYSVVPIQAKPWPGYEWVGWIGDGIKEPSSEQTTIALTADRVAIARMKRVWNLVIIPDPEEGGTVDGAGNHAVGTTVDITATPAEGFTFKGWEGPGVEDAANPATRVTVQSTEHTLIARFAKDDDQQQEQQQDKNQEKDQSDQSDQSDPSDPLNQPVEPPPAPKDSAAMTPEEARQLLNALSESERFLPAGERSRERQAAPPAVEGRDW